MTNVVVISAGVAKFGNREASYRDLITEAGHACFNATGGAIKPKDIDGFIACSVMPERTAVQSHIASLAEECLGINPSTMSLRLEHMCQSGNAGIRTAYAYIKAGLCKMVMVVGAEKLQVPVPEEIFLNMSTGLDREWEACQGVTAPIMFAMCARTHMRKYGTTREQMAKVAVKNHAHAAKNPYAQFQKGVSLEQVLTAKRITTPFGLYDCSPISDGAAAVIITSAERAKDYTDKPVYIIGTGQSVHGLTFSNHYTDLSHWPPLKQAAESAYKMAQIKPADIDVAEIHDCFTIAEIITTEELGFCAKGEGGPFIEAGQSDYGGQVVVNPRGGLLGCGHPLGATGVAQTAEIFWQLRGEAGERQVNNARIGLTHNNSGPTEHLVNIFSTEVV
ncbi:thiolase C-terminal domain-containing protein [Desulfoscipio gibsoniae]|uniref:Acetyl-CoA acetyltransferase n=1 Tax=Desulfoscipio gibsoniae DSM 7213 TaxID=767817 RepID=R4KDL5_9FIRM|nr:propanoyl-CoA C-acyltransferase [Desulfoscipio gibsoniae]AGL00674.1 acetyl-CoA acetyltransferase [Desulfoscipio gibsoniae DSM 7213]